MRGMLSLLLTTLLVGIVCATSYTAGEFQFFGSVKRFLPSTDSTPANYPQVSSRHTPVSEPPERSVSQDELPPVPPWFSLQQPVITKVEKLDRLDPLKSVPGLNDSPRYVLVTFSVHNMDNKPHRLPSVVLIDSRGREFAPSSVGRFDEGGWPAFGNLNPSTQKIATLIFEAPHISHPLRLRVFDSTTSKEIDIDR